MTTRTFESLVQQPPKTGTRMWAYLTEHIFEGIALVFTATAALSYAVGRSYLDGWAEVAGVPGMMFRPDLYDTILAGVKLQSVWRTAAFVFVFATLYLWANVVVPDWWAGRAASVRRRRQRQDGCDHLRLRQRFAHAARAAGRGVPPEQRAVLAARLRWRILGRRGVRRLAMRRSPARAARPLRPITLTLVLIVSVTLLAACVYSLLQGLVLGPARADGARAFVKAYAAVTGHIPYQYDARAVSIRKLQTWACEGKSMLSAYRSVALADPRSAGNTDPPNATEPFYLLQGLGSTFLLLGEKGSIIRSFGDGPFDLPESQARPLSALAKACR
ncbi:hypothetical protein LJR230_000462 [Trinickia sp. LjRoot230]|uniref:hypothetical protein n=1 Tax=Trinickia sp. LjRoot230 TaxID=3342288 RepID=UPI003ED103B1